MKIQVFSSTPVNWEITTLWMHPGENMSLVRFIFSLLSPFPPPFLPSHIGNRRTGISFAIIRAQFTRKPWNRFLRDAAGWLFPYFAFFASSIVAAGWTREILGGGFSSWISSSCTQWYMREIVVLTVIWEFQVKKNEMCTRSSEFDSNNKL